MSTFILFERAQLTMLAFLLFDDSTFPFYYTTARTYSLVNKAGVILTSTKSHSSVPLGRVQQKHWAQQTCFFVPLPRLFVVTVQTPMAAVATRILFPIILAPGLLHPSLAVFLVFTV